MGNRNGALPGNGAKETIDKFAKLISDGWNDQGVTGVLGPLFGGAYSDWGQLGAEFTGTLTNFVFVTLFATVWFKVSNLIIPLRSTAEAEVAGLDLPEMGAEAYPDYQITDRSSPEVALSRREEAMLSK
jgi:ammonium transporter, Amt family